MYFKDVYKILEVYIKDLSDLIGTLPALQTLQINFPDSLGNDWITSEISHMMLSYYHSRGDKPKHSRLTLPGCYWWLRETEAAQKESELLMNSPEPSALIGNSTIVPGQVCPYQNGT